MTATAALGRVNVFSAYCKSAPSLLSFKRHQDGVSEIYTRATNAGEHLAARSWGYLCHHALREQSAGVELQGTESTAAAV